MSISFFLDCAKEPRRRKTIHSSLSEIILITASVKFCHQILECEAGSQALTVKIAFKRKTHCQARLSRLPEFGTETPTSSAISLKIFFKDGGKTTQSGTEKASQ